MISGIPVERRAVMLITSLPIKSKFKNGLADKFLNKYSIEEMRGEGGLKLVKRFLVDRFEKSLGGGS